MTEQEKAVEKIENQAISADVMPGFQTSGGFDLMLRQAKWLAASDLVPKQFKGSIANCLIGMEMAQRMGASPLAVLQNLYIVHGKPGWSAQFIIAAINSTGKFSPLRFDMVGDKEERTCTAWATERTTGERLESPPVSIAMSKAEGWYGKDGSKWKTMPELMLRYRAATFFGRLYAPEVLMGMKTTDEIVDIGEAETDAENRAAETIREEANAGPVVDIPDEAPPVDAEFTEAAKEEEAKAETKTEPQPETEGPGF